MCASLRDCVRTCVRPCVCMLYCVCAWVRTCTRMCVSACVRVGVQACGGAGGRECGRPGRHVMCVIVRIKAVITFYCIPRRNTSTHRHMVDCCNPRWSSCTHLFHNSCLSWHPYHNFPNTTKTQMGLQANQNKCDEHHIASVQYMFTHFIAKPKPRQLGYYK